MSENGPIVPKRPVGRPKKRRDADDVPIVGLWQTDVIRNRDPDFVYEFVLESLVRDKLHPNRIALVNFKTGETTVHDIPGWTIVMRDNGPEEIAGWRPDEGKPVDTVLRHGPHVCMRIHKSHHKIIERAKEQRADAYETRLKGGHRETYDLNGHHVRLEDGQSPSVGLTERPLQRI